MTHEKNTTLSVRLGYVFQSEAYLKQALTHRSAGTPHNERLEFVGDAVLSLVIANLLFKRYPSLKEGELSPLRAELVKGDTLAVIAKELNLGEILHLGPGEIKNGGAERASILADALEAIFGAVFLDGGYQAAELVILHVYHSRIEHHHAKQASAKDSKTELQEYLHAHHIPLATYALVQTEGAPHAQTFHVSCTISSLDLSEKRSSATRKKAEQLAASALLKHLKKT
ncbi:MAG: ribonuclease III [Gammaproteobacteria bacterium]|nr:ribonuclease III [Gammaproteobacteria bacterium]MCH9718112.1 ribonuclease III [Gammaproteobacteria bacterium]MCH9763672.1 ribonuclease III [Gammaproteobacteria bacterium]